jgi:hypothetical protein
MSAQTKKKLTLTSPRKMPKGKRALANTAVDLKQTLQAAVEQAAAQVPTTGLDSDAGPEPQSIGELVQPVQVPTRQIQVTGADGKLRTAKASRSQPRRSSRAVEPAATAKKAEPAAPAPKTEPTTTARVLLDLLGRDTGATVREMLDASGLSHEALKRFNTKVIRGQMGYRFLVQRNPGTDPNDRAATSHIYRIERA